MICVINDVRQLSGGQSVESVFSWLYSQSFEFQLGLLV